MHFQGPSGAYLLVDTISAVNQHLLSESIPEGICILWSMQPGNHLRYDEIGYRLRENQMFFVTEYHRLQVEAVSEIRLIRFNRSFYCIRDHDQEVSCKGLLFYNSNPAPCMTIHPMDIDFFEMIWKLFGYEMVTRDSLQYEMLQTLLKRVIILCTRTYKMEHHPIVNAKEMDLYREFNYLVEMNFKELHTVADYAALLYKSPKTLSNTFTKFGKQTPLMVIQERLLLEAQRLLRYGNLSIKEIGIELGFGDAQTFSRFFRRKAGLAPSRYRMQFKLG